MKSNKQFPQLTPIEAEKITVTRVGGGWLAWWTPAWRGVQKTLVKACSRGSMGPLMFSISFSTNVNVTSF